MKANGKNNEHPAHSEKMDFDEMEQSPMHLIGDISRLMGEKIREKDEKNPMSQKSVRELLFHLSIRDGRTQLDLVNATHLKAPTISVALQKLENERYVTRRPDEYDLRATRVFLTEKGRALDKKIKKRIREEEDLAMNSLTDSEKEMLVILLGKIKKNILNNSMEDGDLY